MIGKRALGAALVLLAASCTAPPPAEDAKFAALRDKAQNSPTLRAQLVQQCADQLRYADPEEARVMALIMRVDEQDLPRVFCRRAIAGIADGRITLDDMRTFQEGRADVATMNRFLPVILDEGTDP